MVPAKAPPGSADSHHVYSLVFLRPMCTWPNYDGCKSRTPERKANTSDLGGRLLIIIDCFAYG